MRTGGEVCYLRLPANWVVRYKVTRFAVAATNQSPLSSGEVIRTRICLMTHCFALYRRTDAIWSDAVRCDVMGRVIRTVPIYHANRSHKPVVRGVSYMYPLGYCDERVCVSVCLSAWQSVVMQYLRALRVGQIGL